MPEDKKEIKKVINGTAVKKKRSFGKNVSEKFLSEEAPGIGTFILEDVLIPAAKNTAYDLLTKGAGLLLYGEGAPKNNRNNGGRSIVSYSSFSSNPDRNYNRVNRRATHNFDDILLESRADAEEVISQLFDLIDAYDTATVADLYSSVGITPEFTDNKWGWTRRYNLASAKVTRVRDGYRLDLPKPIELD